MKKPLESSHLSRRHALQMIGGATVGALLSPWMTGLARAASDSKKKKVLFFTKSSGFEHSVVKRNKPDELSYAEKILTDLGAQHGFDVTCTKDGSIFTPDKIKDFDAFVFYTTGDLTTAGTDQHPPMSKEGKADFLQSIKDGKGFLALHCGSDTFHSPGHSGSHINNDPEYDPYIQMLGGEFIIHGSQQKSTLHVVDPKFPGAPQKDMTLVEEWYSLKNFAPDLHVILVQETAGMKGGMYERKPYPETWARMDGKGRVFFSSMGHREEVWKRDDFQKLLIGGLDWITGRVNADVTPNLEKVAPGAQLPVRSSK